MKASGTDPLRLLVASFLALIACGAALLILPPATPASQPISPIDAIFTATSAVCVTGLVVRDTGLGFTWFGQAVILTLIQLGGIGIMTFSLLVFSLFGGRFSLASRAVLAQSLAASSDWESLWPLLRLVIRFTLVSEVIGALLLFLRWQPQLGAVQGAYAATFHSISAFCNAGFSLWASSLIAYRDDWYVNFVVAALIVLGGVGFLVVHELQERWRRGSRLSLHSKLALSVTGLLIVAGALAIWLLERHDGLAGLPLSSQVVVSLFQSITARTAGFNTIDLAGFTPAGVFLMMGLMFIGGSPGSCAGGIKTTTFGVLVLAAWTRIRRRRHVSVFRRTVSRIALENTVTITVGGVLVSLCGLFVLLFLQAPHAAVRELHGEFVAHLFEVVSAIGTVGLSLGVTSALAPGSRVLVATLMFLGRLGPLTVATALAHEGPTSDWQYAEEDVMVG
jgi:trk system potassium uptake protein TrkH